MKTERIFLAWLILPILTGCEYETTTPLAHEYAKVCIDGVTYLKTHSALDGAVLTTQVDRNGKPVPCEN